MYISIASPLLPALLAASKKKQLKPVLLLIVYLLIIGFVTDVAMLIVGMQRINNLPFAHLYGLVEAVLLIFFFTHIIPLGKRVGSVLIGAYCIFYAWNSIYNEPVTQLNGFARAIEAFLMLFLCVCTLYRFYEKEEDVFIDKSPTFWITVGFLFYFAGALFSFLLAAEIFSSTPDNLFGSWILHNISNVFKNVLIAVGIWKVRA